MRSMKTTAVAVAAGAVALGAGLGAATLAAADPTATPSPPPGQSASADAKSGGERPGGPGGLRHLRPDLAKQLADKLDVSEEKVTAALQEVRGDKPGPGTEKPAAGSRPDPAAREAQLAAPLAKALDVSEAKVKAALAEIRDAAEADRSAAFEKRLHAAVKAGTLTQSEADAVTKAAKLGVINVGPR